MLSDLENKLIEDFEKEISQTCENFFEKNINHKLSYDKGIDVLLNVLVKTNIKFLLICYEIFDDLHLKFPAETIFKEIHKDVLRIYNKNIAKDKNEKIPNDYADMINALKKLLKNNDD